MPPRCCPQKKGEEGKRETLRSSKKKSGVLRLLIGGEKKGYNHGVPPNRGGGEKKKPKCRREERRRNVLLAERKEGLWDLRGEGDPLTSGEKERKSRSTGGFESLLAVPTKGFSRKQKKIEKNLRGKKKKGERKEKCRFLRKEKVPQSTHAHKIKKRTELR